MSRKNIMAVCLALILTLSLASGCLAMGMGGGAIGGMMSAVGSMMSGNRGNMNNMDQNRMAPYNMGQMGHNGDMGMNYQGQAPAGMPNGNMGYMGNGNMGPGGTGQGYGGY